MKIIKTNANKITDLVYGIQEIYALHECEIIRIEIDPVFDIKKKSQKDQNYGIFYFILARNR